MFRVGQKVVCVSPTDNLVKNEIYTITLIEGNACRLHELEYEAKYEGYSLKRFRPISNEWVDEFLNSLKKKSYTK